MQLLEKEIEDFIFDDLTINNAEELLARGLIIPLGIFFDEPDSYSPTIKWFRQLNIDPYGILDIVGFYRYRGSLRVLLIELKATPIESKDFDQIFRYKKGLEVYANQTFKNTPVYVNCLLIGNGFSSGCYIQNNSKVTVSEYAYSLLGVTFKSHGIGTNWAIIEDDHCTWRRSAKLKTNGYAQKIH
jgi:hypothetical protein